jgi:uncharacterized membrane protein
MADKQRANGLETLEHVWAVRHAKDEAGRRGVELGEERVDDARKGLGQGLVASRDECVEVVNEGNARRRRARSLSPTYCVGRTSTTYLSAGANAQHAQRTLLSSSSGPFMLAAA